MSAHTKDIRQLRRAAEKRGWIVENTNGGHIRWRWPKTGAFFICASTPGDYRVITKIKCRLRQGEQGKPIRGT